MDNLPGPPDGISKAVDGNSFWVSIYSEVRPLHQHSCMAGVFSGAPCYCQSFWVLSRFKFSCFMYPIKGGRGTPRANGGVLDCNLWATQPAFS